MINLSTRHLIAGIALIPYAFAAEDTGRAVGIVIESPSGLASASRVSRIPFPLETRLPVEPGDLLFAGDQLELGEQAAVGVVIFDTHKFYRVKANQAQRLAVFSAGSINVKPVKGVILESTDVPARESPLEQLRPRGLGGIKPEIPRKVELSARELAGSLAGAVDRQYLDALERVTQKALAPVVASRDRAEKFTALAVGISKYPGMSDTSGVKYALEDAALFAKAIKTRIGYEAIQLLNPTKFQLSRKLSEVLHGAQPGSVVYLFIAGHGRAEAPNGRKQPIPEAYLVTADSAPDSGTNQYPFRELMKLVNESAAQVVMFLDVCHAGLIKEGKNFTNTSLRASAAAGARGMLASRGSQPAFETPKFGHGLFSHFLFQSGWLDKNFSVDSLQQVFGHALERVPIESGRKQFPVSFGDLNTAVPLPPRSSLNGFPLLLAFQGRPPAGVLGRAAPGTPDAKEVSAAIESLNLANEVLGRYVSGDEFPPSAKEFQQAAELVRKGMNVLGRTGDLEARAQFFESRALLANNQWDDAMKGLKQALELLEYQSEADSIFNAIGIAHYEKQRYEEAARSFRDAIRLNERWAYPRHNLALTYTQQGKYREALNEYGLAIRSADHYYLRYGYLHHNRGILLHKLNRTEEAREDYEKAIEIFEDKAKRFPARARQLAERQAETHNAFGVFYASRRNYTEARKQFDKALEKNPQLTDAATNKERLLPKVK